MATFPSKVNYATGDILTATNMNDVGGAINLLESAQFAAGKNKIINGDFGVWQRGTSFTQTNGAYNADRFLMVFDGAGATRTVSQQTYTAGTAPVSGYEGQYFWRLNQSVAGTSGTYNVLQQKIEDVRTLAGQTATYSFWAKADAARNITLNAYQYFGTGGSSPVQTVTQQTFSATTSWQRFSFSAAVPSISGKTIGTNSFFSFEIGFPSNTVQTIDIWGVQLEAASTASPFQTATGTKQGELAACQRYYWRFTGPTAYSAYAMGAGTGTTGGYAEIDYPVTMRTVPSSIDFANLGAQNINTALVISAITALTLDQVSTKHASCAFAVASGTISGTPVRIVNNNNTAGYIGMSAEL